MPSMINLWGPDLKDPTNQHNEVAAALTTDPTMGVWEKQYQLVPPTQTCCCAHVHEG